ncbi:MAG: VacB/RNase II family 3'-5' exoribonuclease [Verrucomicrobia bacterium]|nr:VacB/RNase II family 3'-5' exoribonuclease [Verrucomicrobiota bacterium]
MSKSLRTAIESVIREPDYQPLNKNEFARKLQIPPREREELRESLAQLLKKGVIIRLKRGRYVLRPKSKRSAGVPATGTIFFRRRDEDLRAYFIADADCTLPKSILDALRDDRILVPGRYTAQTLNRDRVRVSLLVDRPPERTKKKKEGKGKPVRTRRSSERVVARVEEILDRPGSHFVGTYQENGKYSSLRPDDPALPRTIDLTEVLPEAKDGLKVVAEFAEWEPSQRNPVARMVEVLGKPDAPGVDIMSVIRKFQLPLEFPAAVQAEAEAISEVISPAELGKREDWRDRDVFTIDPSDAKDFDDAIHVARLDDDPKYGKAAGGWELAVHIADVSHYVEPGTAMDKEAIARGNSVYLADRVVPMLPEKLSNGICSLRPDVDRLTQAVVIRFNIHGKAVSERFVSAVIHSKRRYTYEEALVGLKMVDSDIETLADKEAAITRQLHEAWRLAEQLRKRRFQQGALDLDFTEVKVILDDKGRARDIVKVYYDETHQLIEEFMLVANEAVAKTTKNKLTPCIYRIHEDADPEKLLEFRDLARAYGHKAGDLTNRDLLQNLLRSIKGKPEEHTLKIALLKSLKRAAYSVEPLGHYGLSKNNYTHFTSPIRRYADLVVHRVLRRLCKRGEREDDTKLKTSKIPRLAEIAKHISETERTAASAEQETRRLKLMEYMLWVSQEKPEKTFEALAYDIKPLGIFVELTDLNIKGLIRKDDLPQGERYFVDSTKKEITASGSNFLIKAGDTMQVRLRDIDYERQFINFELAD